MNRARVARALVMTLLGSDAAVARRHGVSASTIAAWRKRLETDPDLAALYRAEVRALDGDWRRALEVLVAGAAWELRRLQAATHALVLDLVERPKRHGDTGPDGTVEYPALAERLAAASNAQGDLRRTIDAGSEILTHYAAIVAEPRADAAQETRAVGGDPPSGGAVAPRPPAVH